MILLAIAAVVLASPPDLKVYVISEGIAEKSAILASPKALKSQEELKEVWNSLGIKSPIPVTDFKRNIVVALQPSSKMGSGVRIQGVAINESALIIKYFVTPAYKVHGKSGKALFPYLIATMPNPPKTKEVKFTEVISYAEAGTDLGQTPAYTSVLSAHPQTDFSNYIPLDRGNTWTYRVETPTGVHEETYSIVAVTQYGWSVFDSFFGKANVGLRVGQGGLLHVLSANEAKPFYPHGVQINFIDGNYKTPAGNFSSLLSVTGEGSGKFSFKDIYAKDIGLVLHEHKNEKGLFRYTLIKAYVRGKSYP